MLLVSFNLFASPSEYVLMPNVEQGEKEIDFKFGTAKPNDSKREQAMSVGFGLGVTESWFTEIYFIREKAGSEGTSLAEWENKFQLTEPGEYFVDVGLVAELEATITRAEAYELTIGPLLQKDFGLFQINGNLLFTRQYGSQQADISREIDLSYQWQIKYRWKPEFEFGVQGLGEVGKWNDWADSADQNHRLGPAVFGKLGIVPGQAIRYNAAWLLGVSDSAPDNTLRMQIEYEF